MSNEDLIPLARAKIPSNPHTATRWRWAFSGVRGVRLETVIVGGQRFTTDEAIRRFIRALNAPAATPEPPSRTAEHAERKLVAKGC